MTMDDGALERAAFVPEPGSYRDGSAQVFYVGQRVLRGLDKAAAAEWEEFKVTQFFSQSQQDGRLVRTRELAGTEAGQLDAPLQRWPKILEHERVPFISYPYEWSFSMLRDAALLHLDLLEEALHEGFTTKDGTAFNVQWMGVRPVFLDIVSFERYRPGAPWAGYRQFCQLFLFPLMLRAYRKVPFQPWLRGHLDGVSPDDFRKLLSWRDCFRVGVLQHVLLHALLERNVSETSQSTQARLSRTGLGKAELALDIVRSTVRHLRKTVQRLKFNAVSTSWTGYVQDNSYSVADRELKARFVQSTVTEIKPALTWDLGCNTGEYSRLCADVGGYVIAIDADVSCIDRLYLALRAEGRTNILPLVGDLADSSPNMGWRGRERKGLVERGRPDLCLCLALLHHLVISHSLPMEEVLQWLAELRCPLVLEFVDREDPLATRLLHGRQDGCPEYSRQNFERGLRQLFDIEQCAELTDSHRTLYRVRPRA